MAERGLEEGEEWVEKMYDCALRMLMKSVSQVKLHAYPFSTPTPLTRPPPYAPTAKLSVFRNKATEHFFMGYPKISKVHT